MPANSSKSKSPNMARNMVRADSENVEKLGRYTSEIVKVLGSNVGSAESPLCRNLLFTTVPTHEKHTHARTHAHAQGVGLDKRGREGWGGSEEGFGRKEPQHGIPSGGCHQRTGFDR